MAPNYALVHEHDLEACIAGYRRTVTAFYLDGPNGRDGSPIVSEFKRPWRLLSPTLEGSPSARYLKPELLRGQGHPVAGCPRQMAGRGV